MSIGLTDTYDNISFDPRESYHGYSSFLLDILLHCDIVGFMYYCIG